MLRAVLTAAGALYTFGECDSGKLGLTTEQLPYHRVPQPVRSISEPVRQVVCGGGHTVALTGGGLTRRHTPDACWDFLVDLAGGGLGLQRTGSSPLASASLGSSATGRSSSSRGCQGPWSTLKRGVSSRWRVERTIQPSLRVKK